MLTLSAPSLKTANFYSLSFSNPQPPLIHLQMSLPWLPPLLPSLFNGTVFHAFIATAKLQGTQYATVQVVVVQEMSVCLGLATVREPTLQHHLHPLPATPFRWQQLPALESLDHSVSLSMRQHHLHKVSLWGTVGWECVIPYHNAIMFCVNLTFAYLLCSAWTLLLHILRVLTWSKRKIRNN